MKEGKMVGQFGRFSSLKFAGALLLISPLIVVGDVRADKLCFKGKGGSQIIRVYSESKKLSSKWNCLAASTNGGSAAVVGPQGPQGEKGDKGDVGAQGLQGVQGIQGEQGSAGPEGAAGKDGLINPDGCFDVSLELGGGGVVERLLSCPDPYSQFLMNHGFDGQQGISVFGAVLEHAIGDNGSAYNYPTGVTYRADLGAPPIDANTVQLTVHGTCCSYRAPQIKFPTPGGNLNSPGRFAPGIAD